MTEQRQWQFPDARIAVFAKAPHPGQVKTRLAAEIGDTEAARVYEQWLEQSVERICAAGIAPVELWVSPDDSHPLFQALSRNSSLSLHVQPSGDLGTRMQQVFLHLLSWHPSAVLIGSDCPVMPPDYIARALDVLERGVHTVIGPAEDGGYVLLGMNRVVQCLFTDIPWSTAQVMNATRHQLVRNHQHWAELETLWDIDTLDDYKRWLSQADTGACQLRSSG